ncbi:hypothetical protein PspLS_06252 [Pyricularia sp. CBS 133598]|nr:hypothetical protein PspLS_06252 [Pyricularia sp. CBS 133598]
MMPCDKGKAKEPTKDEVMEEMRDKILSVKHQRNRLQERCEVLEKSAWDREVRDAKNLEQVEKNLEQVKKDLERVEKEKKQLLSDYKKKKAHNEELIQTADRFFDAMQDLKARLHDAARGYLPDLEDIKREMAHWDMNKENTKLQQAVYELSARIQELRDLLRAEQDAHSKTKAEAKRRNAPRVHFPDSVDFIRDSRSQDAAKENSKLQKQVYDLADENRKLRARLRDEEDAHKKTNAWANQVKMDETRHVEKLEQKLREAHSDKIFAKGNPNTDEGRRIKQLEERLGEIQVMKSYVEDELDASRDQCRKLLHQCKMLDLSNIFMSCELNDQRKMN